LTVTGYGTYKKYEFQPQTANLYTADLSRGVIDSAGTIDPFYAYGGRKYYYFRTNVYKLEIKSICQITPTLKNIFGLNSQYVKGIPAISNGKGEKPIVTEKQCEPLKHSFTTNGIFPEFIYQAGKSLLFSAGGRFDINSNYTNMFTSRLAAIAHFNHDIFKFIVSGGYLAPSITQTYFESLTSFSWIKTNPNLRANHLINGINAYLTVKNLLNREYYGQTLNAEWGSPKILQDLRRVTFGIEYEFK
jgi:outer membrane receptor protein involved in Fe transport